MIRFLKLLCFALLVSAFLSSTGRSQTINATTCGSSDVQAALNKVAADGATVNIPPGNCTWNTTVSYSGSHSLVVAGAGSQSTVGGGDATVIQDSIAGGSSPSLFTLMVPAGKTLRITGITIKAGSRSTVDNGSLQVFCHDAVGEFRMDHSHIANISTAMKTQDCFGVMDHNVFDEPSNNSNYLHVWNNNYNKGASSGNGDGSWATATDFGTAEFLYLENNTINTGTDDCTFGGRVVGRFNTVTMGGSWQTHPTGGGGADERGCRAYEIYENTMSASSPSNPEYNAFFMSSGTAIVWANSTVNYSNFVTIHSMRRDNTTYGESATPNGWGYCGTSFSGTGSAWDQNTNGSTGYACIDQPGRGKGDLITGMMPNAVNSATGSISWVDEALEPVYFWNNTWSCAGCGGGVISSANSDVLANNRDYYSSSSASCSGASCSSGVGSGSLASRPSSCTTGVGYWATDQGNWNQSGNGTGNGVLYVCSATNTWSLYYTPYSYPHPLTKGSVSSGTVAPPTNLAATVQ